jgi:predicted ester cyclase
MPTHQETANKALFERLQDVTNTHDAKLISSTIDEIVEPNVLIRTPLPVEATGAEALKEVFARLHRVFPDLRVTVEDMIAEGAKVAGRNSVTGTHRGEYLGRTNRPVRRLQRDLRLPFRGRANRRDMGSRRRLRTDETARPGSGLATPRTQLLEAAAPAYLTDAQQATAPADWLDQALAYATAPVRRGAAAALTPAAAGMGRTAGYTTADYLHQHAHRARRTTPIPGLLWQALADHHAHDHLALGGNARRRGRADYAEAFYRQALTPATCTPRTGWPRC